MASPRQPGERAPRGRLDRPPGERYVAPTAAAERLAPDVPTARARGVAWAVLVAIGGAATIVVLAGPFAVSAGLVVVAVVIGRFVALALLAGARGTIPRPARGVGTAVIAVLGVLLGQLGIWLYARSEGGVLAPLDYLGQAFGWLVPVQLAVAAAVAWWSSR